MAFNTGNPIGSTSPRDLSDNAENFDRFANGNATAYDDRLGVSRKSISGMESEFASDQASRATTFANFLASSGYVGTGTGGAIEDYAGGIEITEYNQLIRESGEFYRAKASLSLPYTTTGTWVGDDETRFVSVGDAALRQEIGSGIFRADSLANLESSPGRFDGDAARLASGTGRDGDFRWNSSDLSATLVLASATSDSVDDTTDTINDADHPFSDGDGVITQTTVNGLTAQTVYWVINSTTGTYQLSATFGGGAIDLTGTTNVTIDKLLDPLQGVYVTPTADKTGGSGAWERSVNEAHYIEFYGAKPQTSFDNSSAIASAISCASFFGHKIKAGPGLFEVYQSGVLSSSYTDQSITGYVFEGSGYDNRDAIGKRNTEIRLITGGSSKWLYDTFGISDRWRFNSYSKIAFTSDNNEFAGFMRMESSGWEQGPHFHECWFDGFTDIFNAQGSFNASEAKFSLCKFRNFGAVLRLNNPQSVNHEFFGCDAEVFDGDLIVIESGGGGSIRWFGGSIIPTNSDPLSDQRLVRAEGVSSSALGSGNSDITFYGIKTEMRHLSGLVKSSGSNSLNVRFDSVNFTGNAGDAVREVVTIEDGQSVVFSDCKIPGEFEYHLSGSSVASQRSAYMLFDACEMPSGILSLCVLDSTGGVFESRGSYGRSDAAYVSLYNQAFDFYIAGKDVSGQSRSVQLKSSEFTGVHGFGWPFGTTYQGHELLLPPNAVVYSVKLYREGPSGNTADYQVEIRTKTGDLVSQTPVSQMQNGLSHDDTGIFYKVSGVGDVDGRTLTLKSVAGALGNQLVDNGYAVVEYM